MNALHRTGQHSNDQLSERVVFFFSRNWILLFGLIFGLYVWLPFAAPLLMHWGWTGLAKAIYFIYSFLCHQLPERSFFYFGTSHMYSLSQIQAVYRDSIDIAVLRRFTGSPEMGWKVAWSDRMVYMYASTFFLGLLWWPLRKKIKALPWWGFLLFLLPMTIDGTTHLVSDLSGIGQGFRFTNAWLMNITGNLFSPSFYYGDALGSFNALMRLLTGVFFGIGVVWFGFPYIDEILSRRAELVEQQQKLGEYITSLREADSIGK
jgi:uncharacterized membrane protein